MSYQRFEKCAFFKKVRFFNYFCTLLAKNGLFATRPPFCESLITHKRSIFEESYISNGKRQKSCTLIVI